ncbi:cytochrome P450 [Rhizophagus clarus]|uniref:Cytochrome P450 n=1 Tax=Rhizophagus clarus TaxID=94130 RepID=A0A8H3QEW4_9GLOM|nr:cytochrome P450 [Rhizophagus clarus]
MYQAIILGSILLVLLYILKRARVRDTRLNMPPIPRYKIPIIGHTYSYFFNSEEFLKQCKKEHGDIFSIYAWGQVKTIVGKEYSHEILAREETFSFKRAFVERVPYAVLLKNMGLITPATLLKDHVFYKLSSYSERMQKSLYSTAQKHFNISDQPKVFDNLYHIMTKIVSSTIANVYIGEEESKHDEIIAAFGGLHNYAIRTLVKSGLFNPAAKYRDVLIKHIKKQVCKRLQEKEKYGNSWKRPDDLLQDIIERDGFNPNNINYSLLSDQIFVLLFPSIHTTAGGCANLLMDLASRPQYIQELYEEQLEVHKEADENGILPFEALNNMNKLDSCIRESLRLTGHIVTLEHMALKDYTFSNGLQIPKDRIVDIYADDVYQDESLQGPNPKSFEPFRHVDANVSASKIGKSYLPFGGGKHACPGRHFAVSEIKFFMHKFILNYNFRTESGKIEERIRIGPYAFPSSSRIIIEKRIK